MYLSAARGLAERFLRLLDRRSRLQPRPSHSARGGQKRAGTVAVTL